MKFQNLFFLSGLIAGALLQALETVPVKNPEAPVSVPRGNGVPAPVTNEEVSPVTRIVLRSISERYRKLSRWEANFKQETFSVGLGKGTYNEGRLVFVAPNKFRYSIMQPENSDFICDGVKAWYVTYRDGRSKPAYVRAFSKLNESDLDRYLILLRGIDANTPAKEKKLMADFMVSGKTGEGEITLELKPRRSTEIAKVELTFKNEEDAPPYRARITDVIGNTTTITVTAWKKFKKVNPQEFVPDYPKESTVEKL